MTIQIRSSDKRAGNGRAYRFLQALVGHRGDRCVIWPFSLNRGYGNLKIDNKDYYAHRVMCELVHGPAPDGYEAAHSCGRGHEACVNPNHISWKTKSGNQRDRRQHGTSPTGGRNKLTYDAAQRIRAQRNTKSRTQLATEYGVTRGAIVHILNGRTWRKPRQYK